MVSSTHLKGKVELEYRTEQILLNAQLKSTWKDIILKDSMEAVVDVYHPEVAPEHYGTKVDIYHLLKGNISMCIDLHGTWHEKNKVQVRDSNKRLALEYNGHHYIEIRNYAGAEECPTLWKVVEDIKKLKNATKPAVQTAWQQQSNKDMKQAMVEVSQQLTMQLANSRPRKIEPSSVTF